MEQTVIKMEAKQLTVREHEVEINYLYEGNGDTTLLFLHGWCINCQYWREQIAHFSNNYAVYAPDLPGFGNSKAIRDQWTIEEYAKDIAAFILKLNLKNVVLIGHSMSGDVMLQVAIHKTPGIIGLVGVDNYKFIDVTFTSEQMEEMGAFFKLLQDDFKTCAPAFSENMLFHPSTPAEVKERVKADIANTDPAVGYNSLMNMTQFSQGVPAKLEELPLKLHLINSSASPTNEEGLKKHCNKGFSISSIGPTGHYPMNEKPAEFNRLLEDILQSININFSAR